MACDLGANLTGDRQVQAGEPISVRRHAPSLNPNGSTVKHLALPEPKWVQSYAMARIPKPLEALDGAIADLLAAVVKSSGHTRRDLAQELGMSTNRIGIILRKEPPPATVGEVGLLASVVGQSASEVIAAAEKALSHTAAGGDATQAPLASTWPAGGPTGGVPATRAKKAPRTGTRSHGNR